METKKETKEEKEMRLSKIRSMIEDMKLLLNNKPRINIDYEIASDKQLNPNVATIRLLKGKYAGVLYNYREVNVGEKENEDGTMNLNFDFEIVDSNGLKNSSFLNNKKFQKIIGDILTTLVIESAITISTKDLHDEEAGDNYTEELDTRRRVRKKSSTVSE